MVPESFTGRSRLSPSVRCEHLVSSVASPERSGGLRGSGAVAPSAPPSTLTDGSPARGRRLEQATRLDDRPRRHRFPPTCVWGGQDRPLRHTLPSTGV